MKTGQTESAGYCLISSAKRGDGRFISVVLGAANDNARAAESQKLLNYGFAFYESTLVYKAGQNIQAQKVWKGSDREVPATVANDLVVTLPKGEYSKVKAKIISKKGLVAPILVGQEVATIQFSLDGKVIDQRKLVAAKEIKQAGIFGRMIDSVRMLLA